MPQPANPAATILADVQHLVQEIASEKVAAAKTAAMGNTSHPSANVEDGTRPATEGSRASENTADVKKHVPSSVDATSDTVNQNRQDEVQPNIGMTQSATGEDPSVEDDFKGNKTDSPTSHPATTEGNEKYSSWTMAKLAAELGNLGNAILTDIAGGTKQAGTAPAEKPGAANDATMKAAAAGYELASAMGLAEGQAGPQDFIAATIKEAEFQADMVAEYLGSYLKAKTAGADTDLSGEEDHAGGGSGGADPTAGGDPSGGAPPGGDPSGGGAMPPELMAQLQGMGGGGAPGGDPMAGGMPPGGDPMAGGMPPGGDPGAGGGGEMPPEAAIQELVAALTEMGISPEELMAAMQEQGPAQKAASHKIDLVKIGQAVKQHKRSGKFAFAAPASAKHAAARRHFREFLAEILN